MFGNLRWRKRCGASREQRADYKAQLCTSCHAQREFSGRPSALLANYDQSLLVMVLASITDSEQVQRRCTAVPWRTVDVQALPAELRAFAAASNLALIDAKLRDDHDDGGRWWTSGVRWLLRRCVRRAHRRLRDLGFDVDVLAKLSERQSAAEARADATLTQLARESAQALGELFAHGAVLAQRADVEQPMRELGERLAVAIYALDALEDHDEDRARARFNAIASTAKRVGHTTAVEAAQRAVEYATIEARQLTTLLRCESREQVLAAILQQLSATASKHADRLLGRPEAAAMRPAEAGDCDCACAGCDGCDCCSGADSSCDCGGAGSAGDCCSGCYCDCCCCSSERSRHRRKKAAGE